jgi:hypothetical protein
MLVEFRFPLPFTLEEYQVAQLFCVAVASLEKSDGDSQVDVLANEPYEDNKRGNGQYTDKAIYFGSKLPRIAAALLPNSAQMMVEKAWNAYPVCHTEYSIPFLGDRYTIVLDSMHIENDNGSIENVFNLTPQQLQERIVIYCDIGKDTGTQNEFDHVIYDPSIFKSEKTGRGPLVDGWVNEAKPIMCAYKLAYIKFQVFGFQSKGENMLLNYQRNLLTNFHKQVFCLIDKWYGMTMQDIRHLEAETKARLERARNGTPADSSLPSSPSWSEDGERPPSISSAKSAPAELPSPN